MHQLVKEARLPVFIDTFKAILAEADFQAGKFVDIKELQHPAIKHQLLMETALLGSSLFARCSHYTSSTENMRSRNSGSIWRNLSTRVAPPSSAVWVSTVGIL